MIVGPSQDDWVELLYQYLLLGGCVRLNDRADFLQEGVRVLLRRLDEQLAAVFAEILSEEIEPFFDMCDAGFLGRELQTAVAQKLLDQRPDFVFQHVLGRAGYDEVIRVSNEIDLEPVLLVSVTSPTEGDFQELLQSVQGHVCQRWRDNSALRRTRLRWEQGAILDVACFQPSPQHLRVRGNLVKHPLVAEKIKTTANVAFENPRRVVLPTEHAITLLNCVCCAAFPAKAVGM